MIESYAVSDIRAAEETAMAGLPEGKLMKRAAKGLAAVILARLETRRARRVVALVGPGNNGADTLYAAARVSERGYDVTAVRGDWPVHEMALLTAKAANVHVLEGEAALGALAGAQLVVDGILGIGGRPGLPEPAGQWVDLIPQDAYVIAVDVPSGHDPEGLEALNPDGVFADETVTFGAPKPLHLLPPTAHASGQLTVIDIGLDLDGVTPAVERLGRDDIAGLWPVPGTGDDKYSRGVLGVVAGGEQYTGAALLSVGSAVSSGAGMVRYVGTGKPTALVRAMVPEAVIGAGQVQAWVIGPGMDVTASGAQAADMLAVAREALASPEPVLVDAGGLDLVEGTREAPTLLTPHAGECARLLTRLGHECSREDVDRRPLAHARELADRTRATVLLKGATTLVVPPSDAGLPVRAQDDAPAWLATAGAGDVLSGLAGTLLAAGLDPLTAGSVAALVHGVAADDANPGGPIRASDVSRAIPRTVAGLLRERT
ncbi:MAG: bifunctional ADP-dependent NAD(P)H-hydrate dehydratase/NAD(P)H-hydrate epimerase [Micrococcales bacterium]|nr:bifunctional ADP-dependent NAD(P)H-hydrate dehydratase/NAD(P)H-hydrate epimerase [Micrococcales bacterium]